MGKMKKRFYGNDGMSLIELVVVVLILGIVSAGAFAGLSQANRMDAMGAAGKIESSLELTRMQTLASDSEISLVLKGTPNGYVGELRKQDGTNSVVLDVIEIGSSSLSIKVCQGLTATPLSEGSAVTIKYQKSNGSFATDYDRIVVGGGKTKNVILVKTTGRSYVE